MTEKIYPDWFLRRMIHVYQQNVSLAHAIASSTSVASFLRPWVSISMTNELSTGTVLLLSSSLSISITVTFSISIAAGFDGITGSTETEEITEGGESSSKLPPQGVRLMVSGGEKH